MIEEHFVHYYFYFSVFNHFRWVFFFLQLSLFLLNLMSRAISYSVYVPSLRTNVMQCTLPMEITEIVVLYNIILNHGIRYCIVFLCVHVYYPTKQYDIYISYNTLLYYIIEYDIMSFHLTTDNAVFKLQYANKLQHANKGIDAVYISSILNHKKLSPAFRHISI